MRSSVVNYPKEVTISHNLKTVIQNRILIFRQVIFPSKDM